MATIRGPRIPTGGLILFLDAISNRSYPGTGTTWYDITGNNNYANITNTTGSPYSSNNGGYFTLDGVNDYIVTNNSLNPQLTLVYTNVSFLMWIYPTSAGQILSELGSTTPNTSYHASLIEVNSSAVMSLRLYGASTPITSSGLSFNNWYLVCLSYDGSTLTAYINGSSIGTSTFTRATPITLGFGATHYGLCATDSTNMGTQGYAGARIANFAIYNRALSSREVLQYFYSTKNRFNL